MACVKLGIDLGWMDQNGPMLVRDCIVDGFVNMVMETRGAETRALPRGKGWFSWTLFSAQSGSCSNPKGAAAQAAKSMQ